MKHFTRAEFGEKFPNLDSLLSKISLDSSLLRRASDAEGGNIQFVEILPVLEAQAERLFDFEKDIFAAGERSEVEAIIQREGLQALDAFLESCFDGGLRQEFFP